MIWIFKNSNTLININIKVLHFSISIFNGFSYSRLYYSRVKGIKHFVSLTYYNVIV